MFLVFGYVHKQKTSSIWLLDERLILLNIELAISPKETNITLKILNYQKFLKPIKPSNL